MKDIHSILGHYWGYDKFRPLQEDIIRSVMEGNDTLALLPTGGGKSLCFQVPAMAMDGICVVISPLIALMKDQVYNLRRRNIKAEAVFSGMPYPEMDRILDNCVYGDIKFLYCSPERLKTDLFIERFRKMPLNFIAVDEAHCISQWGYDFRPPYLEIAEAREYFPGKPVLALTATATPDVVDDIQDKLRFRKRNVLQKSFLRSNLAYKVRTVENKISVLHQVLSSGSGSAVVYVRNRKRTALISEYLENNGVTASFYHAGLEQELRSARQEAWIGNAFRVMVATNAFGMGIDKPDVRQVVHMDIPDSLEAYFQEAGRAGRDEKPAVAEALVNAGDLEMLLENFEKDFPPLEIIYQVYEHLGDYFGLAVGSGKNEMLPFDPVDFSQKFGHAPALVITCLGFLEKEGLVSFNDYHDSFTRVMIYRSALRAMESMDASSAPVMLVSALLRSYEGLLESPKKMDENYMGRRIGLTAAQVRNALQWLAEREYIQLQLPRHGFAVTYLEERLEKNNFTISPEHYHQRKKTALRKLKAVKEYFTRTETCRSRMLLAYFGEKEVADCGVCDVCEKRHFRNIPALSWEQFREYMHTIPDGILPADLAQQFPQLQQSQMQQVRQWLDDGKLRMEKNGKMYLAK